MMKRQLLLGFILVYIPNIIEALKNGTQMEDFRKMMCMDISEMRKELLYKEFDSLYRQYMSDGILQFYKVHMTRSM
jgi:hypothetical protein